VEAPLDATLIVTFLVMLVGLIGTVVPGLPGVPLIFISALIYAFLTGFEFVGAGVLVLLGVLAALAFASDFLATTYGVRRFGASNWGTVGGAVGGIVGALAGALFLGIGAIFGLLLGTVGGVFLGEYLRRRRGGRDETGGGTQSGEEQPRVRSVRGERRAEGGDDWRRTSRAAGGALVGMLIGAVAQAVLGVISIAVFVIALFV
jgi:uncharacterized protein